MDHGDVSLGQPLGPREPRSRSGHDLLISQALLDRAADTALACGATALFVAENAVSDEANVPDFSALRRSGCRIIYVAKNAAVVRDHRDLGDTDDGSASYVPLANADILRVPEVPLTRLSQVKIAVFLAMSKNLVAPGDVVVFLAGPAGKASVDMLFVMQVGRESELFSFLPEGEDGIPDNLRPEVVAKVIDIATELGSEGREGKPVGALFVIGDTEHVMGLSRQLVLNPFRGYRTDERNVLDPKLEETVKEFSAIDGAFIIRPDGVIEACGVFLKTAATGDDLPQGLGARHHVAAGITAVTESIAVSVSESTGTVTIFRGGKILTEILKARRRGPRHRPGANEAET